MTRWQVRFFTALIAACDRVKHQDIIKPYRNLFRQYLSHHTRGSPTDEELANGYRVIYTIGCTPHGVPIHVHGEFSGSNLLRETPTGFVIGWGLDEHQDFLEYFETRDGFVDVVRPRLTKKYFEDMGGTLRDANAGAEVLRHYNAALRKFQLDMASALNELIEHREGKSPLDEIEYHHE